jgi:type VI secretion system secreted protein VgrG
VKIGRDWTVDVGRDVLIKAESSITLKCGESTIVMKPATITIKTPSLSISTDNTKIEATMQIEEKAALIKLN